MKAIRTVLVVSAIALVPPAGAAEPAAGYGSAVRSVALHGHGMTDGEVKRRIVAQGFAEVGEIERRPDAFVVEAIRPGGAVFRLTMDAADGALVKSERLGWARAAHGAPLPPPRPGMKFRFDF